MNRSAKISSWWSRSGISKSEKIGLLESDRKKAVQISGPEMVWPKKLEYYKNEKKAEIERKQRWSMLTEWADKVFIEEARVAEGHNTWIRLR